MSRKGWRLASAPPPPAGNGSEPDPRLNWKQKARRAAYRYAIDPIRGRAGVRVLRLPGRTLVLAETVDALRHASRLPGGQTRRLTVVIGWWRAPSRAWSGRVASTAGLRRVRVSAPKRNRGPSWVDLTAVSQRPAAQLLAVAAPALRPDALDRPVAGGSLPGGAMPASPVPAGRLLVDARLVNPRGRRLDAYRADAPWLALDASGAGLAGRVLLPWRSGSRGALSWPTIAGLRGIGGVTCARPAEVDPELLVRLAMTGVIVHAPAGVPDLVAPEVRAILAEPVPAGMVAREERSVRQRRAAIRAHATAFAAGPPSVSVVLATRRAEHISAIVAAMAAQTYPNLELVVCLHGVARSSDLERELAATGRPYQLIGAPEELSYGAVLGLATGRAQGTLLAKVDDDDTYGTEHIWDLVLAHHYSGATMVGKGAEFVFLEDAGFTIRRWSGRPEWDDVVVAGGTILMRRADLEALGGWRPVPRAVDKALLDRLLRAGGTIYRTHPMGYLYHRRAAGHTWDPGQEYFLQRIRGRWDGAYLPDAGPR